MSKVAALRKQTAYEAGLRSMPLEELKERLAASEAGRTYAIEEVKSYIDSYS